MCQPLTWGIPDGLFLFFPDRGFDKLAAMNDISRLTRVQLMDLVRDLQKKVMLDTAQQTEHRETRSALRDSAERLRAILETAVEGIITIDERGIIESFNHSAEKIFSYKAAEAIGQNVKMLMPEPFRHEHDGYLKNYRETGHAKIIGIGREVLGRRKDGTLFPMDLSVSEVNLANRRMFTGFVRDITVRKEAEKALSYYAVLVESSDDAIIGKTLDGYITSWNRGAEHIFGYSRDEVLGKPITILIPEDRQGEEPEILAKIRRGESVDHYETSRRRKDGQLIDISVTVSPIRDSDGKIIGASKVARDITERKRLETEITEISNREQQRIGQDLHDGLCQELTGIELLCQVLEQKLAAKSKAEARQVGEIGEHIRQAIAHTRKLARGLFPVELETNGFMSALDELADHAEKLFKVKCRFECEDLVSVRDNVAATHLYRIAQEAINNAVRHGKAKRIVVSVKPAGNKVALMVADDGIGFSNQARKGSGMGLHTMKYRAGVVGATLQIQSESSKGTTVTCTFNKNL
ncbi:MAG TPA: PAS domain S-box protein [Candidatus Acidoferrales bacterium]|nr:PAS domain S-box protein [Candidatus Acidoferrales bacterium]